MPVSEKKTALGQADSWPLGTRFSYLCSIFHKILLFMLNLPNSSCLENKPH